MAKKIIKAKESKSKKTINWLAQNKFSIGIFILIILFLGGMIWLSDQKKIDLSNIDTNNSISANSNNGEIADHIYEKNNSKVVLIEYGDFQCPGCKTAANRINNIAKEYKNSIKVIFRNFPLTSIHPNSIAAASVVEAAGLQGKYWEMHKLIYEKQDEWSSATASERMEYFIEYANELKLNIEQFKKDVDSSKVKSKISYDQTVGTQVGVSGTPSLYLNGKELNSDIWGDDNKLKSALDEAIKSSK